MHNVFRSFVRLRGGYDGAQLADRLVVDAQVQFYEINGLVAC